MQNKLFDYSFLALGLLTQVLAYFWNPLVLGMPVELHWLNLLSGLAGIMSVFLCSQGKMMFYAFGMLQISTYAIICWWEHLWGQIGMNAFFFVCQCYGIYHWYSRIHRANKGVDDAVPTQSLSPRLLTVVTIAILISSLMVGYLLDHYTQDKQPYLDAFTTVAALFAEVLMILAIRDQWYVWFVVDVVYVVLFCLLHNYCMAMQYAFWTANCVYGYINWTRSLAHE